MPRNWSGPEIEFLSHRLGASTKEAVELFNTEFNPRTYDSIQKKVKSLREAISGVQNEQSPSEIIESLPEIVHSVEMVKVPHVSSAEKREARQDTQAWLEEVVEIGKREIEHLGSVITSRVVRSDNTSLVVVLSDTHFGKHTDGFNMKVAAERLLSMPSDIFTNALPKIDEIVIVLAGDIVEGEDIYATQNNHIECPVFDQVRAASEAIWQSILLYRKLFDCVIRIETVPGNHGRMSKTANEKSNWDNVVYLQLATIASMHGDKDIIINASYKKFRTFQVKDKVGMAYHHGVKHTGTAAMKGKVAGWARVKGFDFMVHGHWHEWKVGNCQGRFVMSNGCLCGPDDLAEQMGVEDSARQGYFLVTPGKPVWGFSFVEWPTEYAEQ